MRVKCIENKHNILEKYEYQPLMDGHFGRFDVSNQYEYPIIVGEDYIILGMIMFEKYLAYLTDNNGLIITVPCYLFEVGDPKALPKDWYFRVVGRDENIYPFIQAIWGYEDLCKEKQAYEKLIVKMNEESQRFYFHKKNELLKEFIDGL